MTQHLWGGGAEKQVAAFANMLVELGEEVYIAYMTDRPDEYFTDPRIIRRQLTFSSGIKIPKLGKLYSGLHLFQQLRKLAADVIIPVNLPLEYCIRVQLATRYLNTRFIYAVRNNLEKKYPDEKDRYRWQKLCGLADGVWLQTQGQRNFFSDIYTKKIFIVPNILDRHYLGICREERTQIRRFISVSRIYPQKNQKLLVRAFARMLMQTKDAYVTLTIYGHAKPKDDRPEKELKKLIQESHLEERVFLLGHTSDIEKRYEEADAFVLSSDYEGCPNALMEAMAAGLPCISTDCPTGPSDLITDGKDGLLVPVGDVNAMACAMQYLVENPEEANRIGRTAKQRMKLWGSREEIAEQLLRQLNIVCSRPRLKKSINGKGELL